MKREVFKIDENGFILDHYPVEFDEQGNCLEELSENIVLVQPEGFYKEKWTGKEWIEGLTQAEIDALNNVPIEPTAEVKLQAQIDTMQGALDFIILNY